MLETMRKNSNSLFMYVLFAGLAAVFALSFGPGSSGFSTAGGGEYAAIVNGEVIPADRYRVAYSREREAITQRFAGAGAGFNTDFLLKGLDNRVIDRLIASVLMKQEAESLGLAVSDEELAEFMSENVFGAEGVTPQVYRDWVRRTFNTTPELYEEDLKADLLGSKVQSLVEDQVTVSDEELESAFRIENNRAQVNFVRFDPNSLGEVPAASEAAINAMIEDKKAELEERYNRDIFKYRVPEERRVRRIVKALPEGADDAAIATLRAELTTLKEQIEGGADFGALATSESDDTESQKDGGDIGFIKRGALPAAIETAVFSLEKDAV
ncbi:MAG: SurA N-terminal domain-containing protein, partial [Myxococcota bacterium]